MADLAYEQALRHIVHQVPAADIQLADATRRIAEDLEALQTSVAARPRDQGLIRERALTLGADAIRALNAMGEAGQLTGTYVRPTEGHLPEMIAEFVPHLSVTRLPGDDFQGRWTDEIALTASRFLDAPEGSRDAAPLEKMRSLLRLVGVVAHGIVRPRRVVSIKPGTNSSA
jgi:hypothetical protein